MSGAAGSAGTTAPTNGSASSSGSAAASGASRSGASSATAGPRSVLLDSALNKPLCELLQQRLGLLDEYSKATRELEEATHPIPSPEQQAADAKIELQRLEAVLNASPKVPETLLPPSFRHASGALTPEMKDDLDATVSDLREDKAKLEMLMNEVSKWDSLQKSQRAERDRLFQRVAVSKGASSQHASGVADAQSADSRRLARERAVNLEWEARLDALQLKLIEAQLVLDAKMIHVRASQKRILELRLRIGETALKLMRDRYRAAAETRERSLQKAAASEETKARSTRDPLESLRARHTAELLGLEVLAVKSEQALATSPAPSLHEQRALADRAEAEFAEIKKLLEDGRVSRLDAIRLNNDFRRIGLERDRLLRTEMASVEAQVRFYEDALTSVELALLQDSLHDRFEIDLVRERLPRSRWAAAEALLTDLQQKYEALLARRRDALEKLSERSSLTLQQITRRLGILDEEYGFIRTHIFWVRDQDPIGLGTLEQSGREFKHLVKALLRLTQETLDFDHWSHPSGEFLAACLAVVTLPFGIIRLRLGLRRLGDCVASQPEHDGGRTGSPSHQGGQSGSTHLP
jgi:hypothetical protein